MATAKEGRVDRRVGFPEASRVVHQCHSPHVSRSLYIVCGGGRHVKIRIRHGYHSLQHSSTQKLHSCAFFSRLLLSPVEQNFDAGNRVISGVRG